MLSGHGNPSLEFMLLQFLCLESHQKVSTHVIEILIAKILWHNPVTSSQSYFLKKLESTFVCMSWKSHGKFAINVMESHEIIGKNMYEPCMNSPKCMSCFILHGHHQWTNAEINYINGPYNSLVHKIYQALTKQTDIFLFAGEPFHRTELCFYMITGVQMTGVMTNDWGFVTPWTFSNIFVNKSWTYNVISMSVSATRTITWGTFIRQIVMPVAMLLQHFYPHCYFKFLFCSFPCIASIHQYFHISLTSSE